MEIAPDQRDIRALDRDTAVVTAPATGGGGVLTIHGGDGVSLSDRVVSLRPGRVTLEPR